MFASIIGIVNINLELFSFRESKNIFGVGRGFDLRTLGQKKTVLFLNTSDTDRTFDRMVNIFHTQVLQALCAEADANPDGRLDVPVRLIFDDFASSAKIPDFDKVISVIRSRDIYVSLLMQSLSQLESMYSPAISRTIINNCDNILFLGGQDELTANFIGCRAHKPSEMILNMPRDKAYLIRTGCKAKLVDKIAPYSTLSSSSSS
jgi:type IV secretion system protein VirD4